MEKGPDLQLLWNRARMASRALLLVRCVTLVLVILVSVWLSIYYNTDRSESEQNGVRYTWLTWIEVLRLLTGLVQVVAISLFLNFVSKKMISMMEGADVAQLFQL